MSEDPFSDDFFKHLFRHLRKLDKFEEIEKFRMEFPEFEWGPGVSGFRIEIRDTGKGRPKVKVSRVGELWRTEPVQVLPEPHPGVHPAPEKKQYKPIKRMLETNVCKVEKPGEIVITMQAPGVDREGVELRRAGNAVEVIARKPTGEAYFCTVELPRDARSDERKVEFKGDILMVTIPKWKSSKVR